MACIGNQEHMGQGDYPTAFTGTYIDQLSLESSHLAWNLETGKGEAESAFLSHKAL